MARWHGALVAILVAGAGCTAGAPCDLRATLERRDSGSTVRFYDDKTDELLATCTIPRTALGTCDSGDVKCADPAGNAVSLCAFNGCLTGQK